MSSSLRKQAILSGVTTESGGNGYTHESIQVTVTATMKNGSLLLASGLEAAAADAATVVGILDAPELEGKEVGDVVFTRVAKRNVIANTDVIKYSDTSTVDTTALTLLIATGVIFQSAVTLLV